MTFGDVRSYIRKRDCPLEPHKRKPEARKDNVRQLLALGLTLLLVSSVPAAAASPSALGSIRAAQGKVLLNGARAVPHTAVFPGDRIRTDTGGSVLIALKQGNVVLQEQTEIRLDPGSRRLRVELASGTVVVRQNPGQAISLQLPGAEVRLVSPSGSPAVCTAALGGPTSVSCSRGQAEILIAGRAEPVVVPAGFQAVRSPQAVAPSDDDDDDDRAGGWLLFGTVTGLALTSTLVPILVLASEDEPEVSPSAP